MSLKTCFSPPAELENLLKLFHQVLLGTNSAPGPLIIRVKSWHLRMVVKNILIFFFFITFALHIGIVFDFTPEVIK